MKNPLVTVFMPVYNCESYISDSLESILNQTYTNLEILLVDDGSTDNSVDIINNFKDPRIRLISNEENKGIPYTRNIGLKEAKGEYLVIMDSDDISVTERIEKQINYLEKNPDIDAVGSYYVKFGGKIKRKLATKYISPEEVRIVLLFFSPLSNPSATVRLKTVKEYNLKYNNDYFVAQDYDFWTQLSKVGNISIIPEFLLYYRSGHENITKVSNKDKMNKRKQIINSIHENLLNYYKIDLSKEEIEVYNELFSQYFGSIDNNSLIESVVNNLKTWNKSNNVFDHSVFTDVLDHSFMMGLSNQQISIKNKWYLYNSLISQKSSKDLLFLTLKHFYYKWK